jgi:hypothetical protein
MDTEQLFSVGAPNFLFADNPGMASSAGVKDVSQH